MSRSALWRQEAGVKEREIHAQEVFRNAVEEGRNVRTKGLVPLYGPDDSFHIHPMLFSCIVQAPYFTKCCNELKDWNAIVDEIYYEVKHVEPWAAGGHQSKTPSSAFCLLLRLLTLRCSEHQMRLLLNHKDSPYIRCIGFLYLRYACEPSQLLKWIQPYFFDDETVRVRFHVKAPEISIGDFVRSLFQDLDYFGTRLPRLPLVVERDLEARLRQADQMEERAKKHISNPRTMDYLYTIGNRIRAQYEDDENPLAWYDAVIDRVITADPETGASLCRPKFVVTFSSYGNTETVTLGDIDLPRSEGRNESRNGTRNSDKYHGTENLSRSHSHRGYNVNRNEKSSSRDRSRSRERDYIEESKFGTKNIGGIDGTKRGTEDFNSGSFTTQENRNSSQNEARKRVEEKTPEERAAIAEKRRKLISRYA